MTPSVAASEDTVTMRPNPHSHMPSMTALLQFMTP